MLEKYRVILSYDVNTEILEQGRKEEKMLSDIANIFSSINVPVILSRFALCYHIIKSVRFAHYWLGDLDIYEATSWRVAELKRQYVSLSAYFYSILSLIVRMTMDAENGMIIHTICHH